ncbi:COMM domain-containing protein 8 isoform X2 [Eurytemora carolleeae]|uniref:COMM domain-containing protein 8 isoform X2 n=1 Tax=Eurytemora carolleeae TaxID=1294199 RepID=UPI000C76B768|nr:COMM domain-containing protein 8 isoform X2 [Eurytemora carolleeae]|eukprot:XP_023332621.1 COMM domain-containing protein 8-like isoform X2 [Eurytemora affinis]
MNVLVLQFREYIQENSLKDIQDSCKHFQQYIRDVNSGRSSKFDSADLQTLDILQTMFLSVLRKKISWAEVFQDIERGDEVKETILACFKQEEGTLRSLVLSVPGVHYQNLDWRLDILLASRCVLKQVRPLVNLRLDLKDEMKNTSFTLHTDLTSIQNINRLESWKTLYKKEDLLEQEN